MSLDNYQDDEYHEPIDALTYWDAFFRSRTTALILIAVAAFIVFKPGLDGPFILDSIYCIEKNPTIQDLSNINEVWRTPKNGCTTQGRPLLNLSFAINNAFSGNDPYDYQVTNLIIHILVAFTLYGLLRGTLSFP